MDSNGIYSTDKKKSNHNICLREQIEHCISMRASRLHPDCQNNCGSQKAIANWFSLFWQPERIRYVKYP